MKKIILAFVLCTLSISPLFSQEAFYIYRNDGDFNGFFYDEVVEMRYSKIALDSTEREQYVTYEVELADTIYRIPLAAIDSIGFQQPEIKLNPKVKFIEQEGMSPYLRDVSGTCMAFENLPTNMVPQVGDVWIGLNSDACAELYEPYMGGSFSLVVERISQEDGWTYAYGHPVNQISDVFEQYITVEELAIDENNQVHRRIAGCTPDGMPRRIKQDEGHGEINLIDFNSTISHSWKIPGDSTEVDLSADLKLKLRLRAAYNIQWYRMIIKITPDLLARVKPSVGISVKREFKAKLSDVIPLPKGIPFPATPPIFELCPMPTLFMNASGKLEGRINLPQVGLGVGMDIVIDSWGIPFPVMGYVHLAEDEPEEPTPEMLDLSAEIKLSGTIYTGVEFQLAVNTNSWFEKILQAGIGMHFTAGPKDVAEISFSHSFVDENTPDLYYLLSSGKITHTWLSLGFNAGAKAKVGWDDPNEVTFLEANEDCFTKTIRLAPAFDQTEIVYAGTKAYATLKPKPDILLLYHDIKAGLFHASDKENPVSILGNWDKVVLFEEDDLTAAVPLSELRADEAYYVAPIVSGQGKTFVVGSAEAAVLPPIFLQGDTTTLLHFNALGTNEQSVSFTTNCPPERISVFGDRYEQHINYVKLDTLDLKKGKYQVRFKARPNRLLFAKAELAATDINSPGIGLVGQMGPSKYCHFAMKQDDNTDFSNVHVRVGGIFGYKENIDGQMYDFSADASYDGKVNVQKSGNTIVMSGTTTENDGDYIRTHTLQMTLEYQVHDSTAILNKDQFIASGTITTKYTQNGIVTGTTSLSFEDVKGYGDNINGARFVCADGDGGRVTSGSYYRRDIDGTTSSGSMNANLHSHMGGSITVKLTGEQ